MWPDDHKWCFEKARIVLRNDNREKIDLIDQFANEINQGLELADTGAGEIATPICNIPVAPVMHYLDPTKNMGIGGWISIGSGLITNAALFCESCSAIALQLWQRSDKALSMKVFGVALHLVQDLTVPHHARCQVLFNHREYEDMLHQNIASIPNIPASNGIYDRNKYPVQWAYYTAREAYGYFGYCDGMNRIFWNPFTWFTQNEDNERVRNAMVPLAIMISAGFIDYYLSKI